MGDPTGGCGGRVCSRAPFCRMKSPDMDLTHIAIDRYALLSRIPLDG